MLKRVVYLIIISIFIANVSYADVVDTEKEMTILKTTDGDLTVSDELNTNIENLKKHTVIVFLDEADGEQYHGAGYAIDKRHILTVNHLTSETGSIFYMENETSQPYWATIVKQDADHDLALLEIDKGAPDLIAEPMSFAKEVVKDEEVYTIGHPWNNRFSLTNGKVGWLKAKGNHGIESVLLYMKLREGNSGGIVINKQGEILGMFFSFPKMIENWSYMIGKDEIQNFIK
jgi:S1-C subfamily serine protease